MDEQEQKMQDELNALIADANTEREEELKEEEEVIEDDITIDDIDDKEDDKTEEDLTTDDDYKDDVKEDEINEVKKEEEESKDTFTPIEVVVNGHKISIESQAELVAFATKGLTGDSKKVKEDSEADSYVKQGKLTKEDLTLMIDAKNGDANAIAKLAEIANIDVLDVEAKNAANYKPKFEPQFDSDSERAAQEIMQDTSHAEEFRNISNTLPGDFINELAGDAQKLRAFSGHIKSGLAQKAIPLAIKEQATNGGDFFSAYAKVGRELSNVKPADSTTKEVKQERVVTEKERKMRERAKLSKDSGEKSKKTDADDIWNMTDADFINLDKSTIK